MGKMIFFGMEDFALYVKAEIKRTLSEDVLKTMIISLFSFEDALLDFKCLLKH